MRPTDLSLLRTPTDVALAPDGSAAVVAVQRLDLDADAYRSDLWLVPTDGTAPPRRFTRGPIDGSPRFSPDGRWLAFVRSTDEDKPQLHVMPVDGGEPRALTDHPLGVSAPAWSPDSRRVAYVARVPEEGRYGTDPDVPPEKEPPRRITTFKYRLDNVGFTLDRRSHVFVVDAHDPDGEPTQITTGDYDHEAPTWHPDGSRIAFVSARHEGRDEDLSSDVLVVPAGGGEERRVTRTAGPVGHPAFAPDGERIYFAGVEGTDVVGRSTNLWAVPTDGAGPPTRLTDAERWEIDSDTPSPLAVTDAGVTIAVQERGGVHLRRVPAGGGEPELVLGGRRRVRAFAGAGGTLVAAVATDTSAGELVVLRDGREQVLTAFGADLAEQVSLRPMAELDASAPDGSRVHGWLVKPEGDGPFPVLLAIHGGPFTQYGHGLFDEAQVYAGAGYAVVLGNPRGSSGYGEAHGRSIVGDFGNLDAGDLLALLDEALEDPDLDAARVGVLGGSYGGWMSTWLAAHHGERFRAAIVERALVAFDSFTGSSDIGWYFTDHYAGTDPARQRAQSPLTHAGKIQIPTLIIHSEQDWRCPVEQAQRLFVALKRRGVDTELLLFPGEGHELSRSGLPSHRVARFEAILDWWSRHL
jgi:dipeptidyl aminopeptidase/acylaminoacyl peptidase